MVASSGSKTKAVKQLTFPNLTTALTQAVAKSAKPPPTGDYIIRDSKNQTTGLALRVYASGAKTWIVQKKLARKPRRFVIGGFPDVNYTQAERAAISITAKVKSGIDPHLEVRQQQRETETQLTLEKLTVQKAFENYQAYGEAGLSSTTKDDLGRAGTHLASGPLWKMPLLEVRGGDLEAEYRRLKSRAKKKSAIQSGATQAGKVLRMLRAAFKRQVLMTDLEAVDPFDKLNALVPGWYRTNQRSNIIARADGELKRWWDAVEELRRSKAPQATDSRTIADYLVLSLLFGGRRHETLSLRWANVDLRSNVVEFPKEDTKGKRAHYIPFGPYARQVIVQRYEGNQQSEAPSDYVFNASRSGRAKEDGTPGVKTHLKEPKKAIARVTATSGIKFTPHDLRRTFGTLFAELPISEFSVEKALNHAPRSTAGKHYVQTRLEPQRANYIRFEQAILKEAGAKFTVEKRNVQGSQSIATKMLGRSAVTSKVPSHKRSAPQR